MLDQKQLTALNLLLDGHTVKDVAVSVGINTTTLYRWINGDVTAGKFAVEFSETLKKLKKNMAEETNENLSQIRLRLSKRLREWVDKLRPPLSQDTLDHVIDIVKALKEPPQRVDITQIYNMQFQTPEDVVHEFKRLSALAGDGTFAPDRGSIQGTEARGSIKIPLPPERRGKPKKKNKGDSVLPESEAGSIPSESSED
jgi:transposase-like protein